MWHNSSKIHFKSQVFTLVRTKTTNNHDQYIQRSKIPTLHFQQSLPRLPIPKLESTCERYLAAQRPLLIDEAFHKTEANVQRFKSSVGQKMQEMLIENDKKNKHTSYITEYWFDKYLRDRTPLPINLNPVLMFQNDPKKEYCDQVIRASNLIVSALKFYKSLKENILEPEVFHLNPKKSDTNAFRTICALMPPAVSWYAAYMYNAYPLDMSQYHHLFNTTRIPETDKDRIYKAEESHISVQFRGNFYIFDVLDKSGNIKPAQEIFSSIKSIMNDNVGPAEFPLGVLTTLDRNKWATVRYNLAANGNDAALKLIDGALFNVCLDENVIGENKYELVRSFLHGDGANRWFDKSLSLQLSKDGYAAINFEHSWGDGVAVLRFFQDILKDSTTNPQIHPDTETIDLPFKRLEFNIDDASKVAIKEAASGYKDTCKSLDVNFVESEGLGKVFCKKYAVSPDSIMQLCFQNAYYKQYGRFVPTYESCSTAAFKHGRTETIRPCTMSTKKFCLAVNSKSKPSNAELSDMIKQCSVTHGQLTKEAAMGQGYDRHLFALKMLSDNFDLSHANIFEDPAYEAMNHNILSTSTLSSPAVLAGGFGPVVRDGFGVGYVIRENAMGTLATSYPGTDGKTFISCFEEAMKEVVNILAAKK